MVGFLFPIRKFQPEYDPINSAKTNFPKAVMDDFEKEGFRVAKELQMISGGEKVLLLRSMPFGYEQMLKIVQAPR